MADTPAERTPEERAALYRRIPAYALLRATIAHDHDAAVLIVSENTRPDLLVFEVASIAARVLLASEGYDLAKVLRTLDFWMETAANGVPRGRGGPPAKETSREHGRSGLRRGGAGGRRAYPCLHRAGPLHGGRASWPAGPPVRNGWRSLPWWPARPPSSLPARPQETGTAPSVRRTRPWRFTRASRSRQAGRLTVRKYIRTPTPLYGPASVHRAFWCQSPASASAPAAGAGSAVVASGPP